MFLLVQDSSQYKIVKCQQDCEVYLKESNGL